jgi:hypothetical protein
MKEQRGHLALWSIFLDTMRYTTSFTARFTTSGTARGDALWLFGPARWMPCSMITRACIITCTCAQRATSVSTLLNKACSRLLLLIASNFHHITSDVYSLCLIHTHARTHTHTHTHTHKLAADYCCSSLPTVIFRAR